MSQDIQENEVVEIDEPAVVEGIFFRQGLQALEEGAYDEAVRAFERITHSHHFGPHYFLGVASLRSNKRTVEESLLGMLSGIEMMLSRCEGVMSKADPSILASFAEEVQNAVSTGQLHWKNEEFDLDGSFEELQTLVQEVKAQLNKGNLDHGLITELCCAVLSVFKKEFAEP